MKIAFAGKGGAGKTSLAAWTADYLARRGHNVWLVDADTALSLGAASGLEKGLLPPPLAARHDLLLERIGQGGLINLNPEVGDLPEELAVVLPPSGGLSPPGIQPGVKRLLVMGSIALAGGGCACEANALLKAVLAHLILERDDYVLVDLEAGVEHLGRGTVAGVDALVVVSEPSLRGLEVAASVCRLAEELGLTRCVLALNRAEDADMAEFTDAASFTATFVEQAGLVGLPRPSCFIPVLPGLARRMLRASSVLALPEESLLDEIISGLLAALDRV